MVKIAKKAKETKKLDKKEIKQDDQFIQQTEKSVEWVAENRNLILGLIAGVFVVFFVGYVFNVYSRSQAVGATKALSEALKTYQADISKKASTDDEKKTFTTETKKYEASVSEFQKVLSNQKGHVSVLSTLFLANSQFFLKKYEEAKKSYQQFLQASQPSDTFYFMAVEGLSYTLEALKDKDKYSKLEEFSKQGSKEFQGLALLRLAEMASRCQDTQKAKATYETLKKHIDNYYQQDAAGKIKKAENKSLQNLKSIVDKRLAMF